MNTEQFNEIKDILVSINNNIELLTLYSKMGITKPEVTTEESKVLKLCKENNTIEEIVKKTGKKKSNVAFLLSQLRTKGLIISIKKANRLVYKQL